MKAQEQALGYLRTLGLQGVIQGLDELVNDAERIESPNMQPNRGFPNQGRFN